MNNNSDSSDDDGVVIPSGNDATPSAHVVTDMVGATAKAKGTPRPWPTPSTASTGYASG